MSALYLSPAELAGALLPCNKSACSSDRNTLLAYQSPCLAVRQWGASGYTLHGVSEIMICCRQKSKLRKAAKRSQAAALAHRSDKMLVCLDSGQPQACLTFGADPEL